MKKLSCALIVGITSGIGAELAAHLDTTGLNIVGTSRNLQFLGESNQTIYTLDLSSRKSIDNLPESSQKVTNGIRSFFALLECSQLVDLIL